MNVTYQIAWYYCDSPSDHTTTATPIRCLDEALDVLPRPLSISLQAPKGTLQSGQVPGDWVELVELWCRWITDHRYFGPGPLWLLYTDIDWLVVWHIFFIFHNIWDNPSHWLSYFSEGFKPPTSRWLWTLNLQIDSCGSLDTWILWILRSGVASTRDRMLASHLAKKNDVGVVGLNPISH